MNRKPATTPAAAAAPAAAPSHLAALILAAILLASPASAGWTQRDGNAARTGAIDDGPAWGDVALEVQLPGVPVGTPAIVGRHVYVGTFDGTFRGYDHLDETAWWRIDRDTGDVEKVATFASGDFLDPAYPTFFVTRESQTLEAHDSETGRRLWSIAGVPSVQATEGSSLVWSRSAWTDDVVFVPFVAEQRFPGSFTPNVERGGLVALDRATGEFLWEVDSPDLQANLTGTGITIDVAADDEVAILYVMVQTDGLNPLASRRVVYRAIAFDAPTGDFLWEISDEVPVSLNVAGQSVLPGVPRFTGGEPVLTPTFAFIRTDRFLALNPSSGARIWTSEAGLADPVAVRGMVGGGWRDGVLVGHTAGTIYRLDPATGAIMWQDTQHDKARFFSVIHDAISPREVFTPILWSSPGGNEPITRGIEARDIESGKRLWDWKRQDTLGPSSGIASMESIGDGIAVMPFYDGTVVILGRTGASMPAAALADTAYPAVDETIRVDLGGSAGTALGAPTRFRADWGDGLVTDWQQSPVFEHAYTRDGPVTARFTVGNDANQTRTTAVTYRVGETAPNFLSTAFSPENQELTFFVLGLAFTGAIALWGFIRIRRRLGLLQRELLTVNTAYQESKGRIAECERILGERRAHAHVLLTEGKLDESKFALLEKRIDELQRQARTGLIDERLDYLPRGLARHLERMLVDGTISQWEQEAFEALLERDRFLTGEQKRQVREVVRDWAQRDQRIAP